MLNEQGRSLELNVKWQEVPTVRFSCGILSPEGSWTPWKKQPWPHIPVYTCYNFPSPNFICWWVSSATLNKFRGDRPSLIHRRRGTGKIWDPNWTLHLRNLKFCILLSDHNFRSTQLPEAHIYLGFLGALTVSPILFPPGSIFLSTKPGSSVLLS